MNLSHQVRHHWFTPEAWEQHVLPLCERMDDSGGLVCVMLQVDPRQRNYVMATAHKFDLAERKAIKGAIERCRARKAAKAQ